MLRAALPIDAHDGGSRHRLRREMGSGRQIGAGSMAEIRQMGAHGSGLRVQAELLLCSQTCSSVFSLSCLLQLLSLEASAVSCFEADAFVGL